MRIWVIFILVGLLFGCNGTPSDETVDGILEVPENRQNPNSRTLHLVYKVLKAKNTDSKKNPILYLQGGPGAATLVMESFWENHFLRDDRDIVLMDQRGTGTSEANCIQVGNAMFAILREDLTPDGEIKAQDLLLSKYKEAIKQKGVDLAGYTSQENAADFEDLRKALGYKNWNLYGVSYGSRLGLTIMRDFPKSVRSALLVGILAPENNLFETFIPNFENSLFSVLERCEQNEDCNKRYPNLKERLVKTLNKIRGTPLRLNYKGKPLVINLQDALFLLHQSLYSWYSVSNIPLLIESLEKEETEMILTALERVEFIYGFVNWPMNYSVMAYEELPFNDFARVDETLNQSELGFDLPSYGSSGIKLLEDWHSFRAPSIENQSVISEIPTLMVSGSLDPVTPPSNAKEALSSLKNGYEIVFQDDSHEIFNPCFFQIAEEFLNNPLQKVNSECSNKRKPIEWN
ncbi:MAG: alpha/beta fold hydrolase [Maribacter sp.]